ncbi:MAG: tetratricopeptide repeat protein [Planctomycetes bacterium]|nr:tetratricopeptide repeat protein [Planctomycetota bacterium]
MHVAARNGLFLLWTLAVTAAAQAEDQVVLRSASVAARMTISGTIEDYTGTEITIRPAPGEAVRTFPARDVLEFQTTQTKGHTLGIERLEQGQVAEAIRELEVGLKQESRVWMRREIVALLVQASLRRGDYAGAGTRFLALVKSDATTRHFRLIPLVWSPEPVSSATADEARSWLVGATEPARLLGASLLYTHPELGREARSVLKKLASSADPRIQVLAQSQAWRDEALGGAAGKLPTAQWQRRIDEIPEDLRAGPNYLLGRAYAARHDYELAAATLLWLPLVDDHDPRLAARALLEAAMALEKIGQRDEARGLYQEVVRRFPDSPAASEATRGGEARE